jgi:hypothetical protein
MKLNRFGDKNDIIAGKAIKAHKKMSLIEQNNLL